MSRRVKRVLDRLDVAMSRFFVLSSYPYVDPTRSSR